MTIELTNFLQEKIKPYLTDFYMNLLERHIDLEVKGAIIAYELQKIRESKKDKIK